MHESGGDQTELQKSCSKDAIGQRCVISSSCSFMNGSETKGRFSSSICAHLPLVCLCRRKQGPRALCNFLKGSKQRERCFSFIIFSILAICETPQICITMGYWSYSIYLSVSKNMNFSFEVMDTFCRSPQRCTESESSAFSLVRRRRSCCATYQKQLTQMLFNPLFIH